MFTTYHNRGTAALERAETGGTSATMAGKNSDGIFDVSRSQMSGYDGQKAAQKARLLEQRYQHEMKSKPVMSRKASPRKGRNERKAGK